MVVPEEQLRRLLLIHPGDIFSRKLVTSSQELMSYRLGADGYAFSKIDPVPTPDNDKKTVSLTFFIEPGNRVYVRHINFNNTTAINDETLRREMRQLEGGWLSNSAIERSKERLQRLPYVEKVEFETKPVAGSADLVDVDYNIKEGLPGQFGGGIGYSEAQKFSINGNFVHSNFMGTGDRVALEVNAGKYSKTYTLAQTDPYTTIDGVARTHSADLPRHHAIRGGRLEVLHQAIDGGEELFLSHHRVPVPAGRRLRQQERAGGLAGLQLAAGDQLGTAQRQHLHALPGRHQRRQHHQFAGQPVYRLREQLLYLRAERRLEFRSRNRAIFADRGTHIAVSARYALPRSEVKYYATNFQFLQYIPLYKKWLISYNAQHRLCQLARQDHVPAAVFELLRRRPGQRPRLPREHLGPPRQHRHRQSVRRQFPGDQPLRAAFSGPDKWKSAARVSWFYDMGNVFYTGNKVQFLGEDDITPVNYHFSYDNLKRSTGIAVQWLAPLGLFRFSYGIPLNAYPGDTVRFNDETERFQFSIGQAF